MGTGGAIADAPVTYDLSEVVNAREFENTASVEVLHSLNGLFKYADAVAKAGTQGSPLG